MYINNMLNYFQSRNIVLMKKMICIDITISDLKEMSY